MPLRRRILSLAILIGLVGALLAATTAAVADPVYGSFGTLDLVANDTDGDAFVFTSDDGLTVITEPFSTASQTKFVEPTSGPTNLSKWTAYGPPQGQLPYVGLKDHLFGVRAKGEGNGTPASQINDSAPVPDGQKLTIELDGVLAGNKASYAQLGLKFKFGASVLVEAYDGSNLRDSQVESCTGGDCGADSGEDRGLISVGDPNSFDVLFTRVEITISEFDELGETASSDGGASLLDEAGFNTYFTIVEEFEGELECGDTVSETDGGITGTFTRIDDSDTNDCDIKPYNLVINAGDETILFAPQGDAATYSARLTKSPDTAVNPQNLPELEYDPLGGTAYQTMPWCVDPVIDDEYPDSRNPGSFITAVTSATIPNFPIDTWCIARIETDVFSPTQTQSTWTIFGLDDPSYGWK